MFYQNQWAKLEVYNDLNDKLVNLFRCVKFHPDELIKEFRWMMASRRIFKETLDSNTFTDIQKAAKFLYLVSRSFGGAQRHFGTGKRAGVGYETTSYEDFEHEKLRNVLKNIKGKFLLSCNDSPMVRKLYKDFEMIELSRQKGINNKYPKGREYKEFL